jgi:hypothetical protein
MWHQEEEGKLLMKFLDLKLSETNIISFSSIEIVLFVSRATRKALQESPSFKKGQLRLKINV